MTQVVTNDEALIAEISRFHAENVSVCESAGHEWVPAGGGLMLCVNCMDEHQNDGWDGSGYSDPSPY